MRQPVQTASESQIQKAYFQWVRWMRKTALEYSCIIHVPNGGYRHAATAARLKEEGVSAGVPDILILFPSGPYPYAALETKSAKGQLSEAQETWRDRCISAGAYYKLCRSTLELMEATEEYFSKGRGNGKGADTGGAG